MPNNALDWKEKYLALLDKQEALENNFATQTELLKRALVRSSLAAEGQDEQLDQELHTLRALVRQTINTSKLENHIEHLEQAVLKSEVQAQQRQATLQMTLAYLVQQLLQLQLPKALQKTLKAFAKDLSKQLAQQHGVHKVLGQFKELQEQALIAAQPKQQQEHTTSTPGLFARLFKSSDAGATQSIPADTDTATEAEPALNSQSTIALAATNTIEPEPSLTAAQTRLEHSYIDDVQPLSDISYSSVAQHIHTTLMGLLNDLPISSEHEQQAQELRQRLTDGLNWYELVPLLDELSVIIIATAQGASDRELTDYLRELNQRLTSFYNSLESTSNGYLESMQDAKTFDNDLRLHVTDFQDEVQTSNDLASLKKLVDARLDSVVSTLQVYQEKRTSSEAQIIERLQALSEHSRQMEQEAQQLSVKLEEQRQQALIDPLTGLANRAAWNERSVLEHANLQAHNSLLLSIIDIDHFKRINDNYGHLAGDKVLKIIASELQKRLRKTDFIARFGGEEYAVLMPDTPLEEGCELINTLRLAIAACPFNFKGEPVSVTLSAGVGKIAADESLDQAFDRVDQALYAAKKAGRNRIQSA